MFYVKITRFLCGEAELSASEMLILRSWDRSLCLTCLRHCFSASLVIAQSDVVECFETTVLHCRNVSKIIQQHLCLITMIRVFDKVSLRYTSFSDVK